MPIIDINGVSYHASVEGDGAPILLLHGFTGAAINWSSIAARLTGTRRVVTIDILGHGKSASPEDEKRYAIEHVAADLLAILDRFGLEQVSVLGYSMGGRLALYLALSHPDRVDKLLLESAQPGIEDDSERVARVQEDRLLADWIVRQGIHDFVVFWENIPMWASQGKLSSEEKVRLHEQRLQNNPIGLANSLRGMGAGAQPSLWNRLHEIVAPVQLVVGELDSRYVDVAERMKRKRPDWRLEIIKDAGHCAHLERPEDFFSIVERFVVAD